ncbi:MAG: long-chain fatty acid--CoA ligase [Deltaproteobacteria bacterium]|nr:long-chain fatty acid--CoA ligase [Deltaproteobacteria bacterium]
MGKAQGRVAPEAPFPWLPFYDPGVSPVIAPVSAPLYDWLDRAAAETPERPACIFYNTRLTYAALRRLAETVAANLRRNGVRPGDRVGVMLPNMPQTIIVFWGILKAGGVVTMINPLYKEKELLHQIRDAGAAHLVSIDLCWPRLNALRDRLGVRHFYITTAAEGLSFPLNWLQRIKRWWSGSALPVPFDQTEVHPFAVLLKGRKRLSHPVGNPEKTLDLLQYTGGTTGLSKGAMLSHANLGANLEQLSACLGFLQDDGNIHVLVGVLPFFHVYGLMTSLLLPVRLRAASVPVPRYVPAELLDLIAKHKGTILPGAPAIFISLMQQKDSSRQHLLSSLFCCISGSAPMPPEVLRHYEENLGVRIIEGYGLSEASPVTHLTPLRGLRKIGAVGIPLPGTEARIVDMNLGILPLPPGEAGELILRGPQVMSGYWNNPDETAGALRNGWLYTGDIALMDEDGYFQILDRKKDLIVVGGYNVAPREIDEVLFDHPKIQEAVAVGVPHPSRGEIIKAYVVLKSGETATRAEIVSWCRERLASYKVPRQVEFRLELPKTTMGKTLRRVLRAEEAVKQEAAASAERPRQTPEDRSPEPGASGGGP